MFRRRRQQPPRDFRHARGLLLSHSLLPRETGYEFLEGPRARDSPGLADRGRGNLSDNPDLDSGYVTAARNKEVMVSVWDMPVKLAMPLGDRHCTRLKV